MLWRECYCFRSNDTFNDKMKKSFLAVFGVIFISIALLYIHTYFTLPLNEEYPPSFYFKVLVAFVIVHYCLVFFLIERKKWIYLRSKYPEEFRGYFGMIHPGYMFIIIGLIVDQHRNGFVMIDSSSEGSGLVLMGWFWILGTEFYRASRCVKVLSLKIAG